jgi:hypothetical protein
MSGSSVAFLATAPPTTKAGYPLEGLARAYLEKHDARPAGAGGGALGSSRGTIEFQFNPKELSLQKAAKWERQTSRTNSQAGPPEFKGAQPCKMTLAMFFDGTRADSGNVVHRVEELLELCVPTPESLRDKKAVPPLVVFRWGGLSGFAGFITSVDVKYTLFAGDGHPLRAQCNVTIEEMPGQLGGQNPTSGTLAPARVHTATDGDELALLAHREYGDPGMWRSIAEANDIDDPQDIRPGATLLMPAAESLPVPAR